MSRFGRGFPPSGTNLLVGQIRFEHIQIDLSPAHEESGATNRGFSAVLINDSVNVIVENLRVVSGTTIRDFAVKISSDITLPHLVAGAAARTFDTNSVDIIYPVWDTFSIPATARSHAFNRLQQFDDPLYSVGLDFAPIVSQFGFWRVSDTLRDTVALDSKTKISSNFTIEGKP